MTTDHRTLTDYVHCHLTQLNDKGIASLDCCFPLGILGFRLDRSIQHAPVAENASSYSIACAGFTNRQAVGIQPLNWLQRNTFVYRIFGVQGDGDQEV